MVGPRHDGEEEQTIRSLKNTLDDGELRERVREELELEARIDPSQLHVHAEDGAVTLSGTVTTHSQRRAGVRAAQRVQGVRAVADDIEVVLSREVERKDSEIAEAIAHERSRSDALPDSVEAEVRSGQVVLRGHVACRAQRDEAARVVRELAGVRGVANDITVEGAG
jgi:osmotically-inducible protein OsmY